MLFSNTETLASIQTESVVIEEQEKNPARQRLDVEVVEQESGRREYHYGEGLVFSPDTLDGYFGGFVEVQSYISCYKTKCFLRQPMNTNGTNLDLVRSTLKMALQPTTLFHPSPEELPISLTIFTTLSLGASFIGNKEAAKHYYMKALQLIPSLYEEPNQTLASTVFTMGTLTLSLVIGVQEMNDYLTLPPGGDSLWNKSKTLLRIDDANSYTRLRFMIWDLIANTDAREALLSQIMGILEEGVEFEDGFLLEDRKDIILNYYFSSHILHIIGILLRAKSHRLPDGKCTDPNLTREYFVELHKRILSLWNVNEGSSWKGTSLKSSCPNTERRRMVYNETKSGLLLVKYLTASVCNMEKQWVQNLAEEYLSCYENDLDHGFSTDFIGLPLFMDSLLFYHDYVRASRLHAIVKRQSSIHLCLVALSDSLSSKLGSYIGPSTSLYSVQQDKTNGIGNKRRHQEPSFASEDSPSSASDDSYEPSAKKKKRPIQGEGSFIVTGVRFKPRFDEFVSMIDTCKGKYTTNLWRAQPTAWQSIQSRPKARKGNEKPTVWETD
eukprot:TRINITY_DN3920_c0_g1_i1.p1 TRINITY_DN3920_c0_g1~~TRINITY_DN3920_c0_g1_i1.p1  ORF type:complete len:553 (-),score=61.23 TRINITY_DN3920_c0_g1_i1:67-1725(-)